MIRSPWHFQHLFDGLLLMTHLVITRWDYRPKATSKARSKDVSWIIMDPWFNEVSKLSLEICELWVSYLLWIMINDPKSSNILPSRCSSFEWIKLSNFSFSNWTGWTDVHRILPQCNYSRIEHTIPFSWMEFNWSTWNPESSKLCFLDHVRALSKLHTEGPHRSLYSATQLLWHRAGSAVRKRNGGTQRKGTFGYIWMILCPVKNQRPCKLCDVNPHGNRSVPDLNTASTKRWTTTTKCEEHGAHLRCGTPHVMFDAS